MTFFTIQIALILISSRECGEFYYQHRRNSSSSPTVTEAELCGISSSQHFSHKHHPSHPHRDDAALSDLVRVLLCVPGPMHLVVLVPDLRPLAVQLSLRPAGHLHHGTPDWTLSVPVPSSSRKPFPTTTTTLG